MSDRPVYLLKSRQSPNQRAHFAIFIPVRDYIDAHLSDSDSDCIGTKIHVVGAPMNGYAHEIKWSYNASVSATLKEHALLGYVSQESIENTAVDESDPRAARRGDFIDVASRIVPPRASANFLAPVNDVRIDISTAEPFSADLGSSITDAVRSGRWTISEPLCVWMYCQRMPRTLLSQSVILQAMALGFDQQDRDEAKAAGESVCDDCVASMLKPIPFGQTYTRLLDSEWYTRHPFEQCVEPCV